jgi:Tfp pilus tip-associated adhesin PilY1
VERIQKTAWEPRMIFNASFDPATNAPTPVDRPIYFRPSVIFDAKLGTYLIAFGTGDRDDLWNNDGQTGRFYVFLDDTDKLSSGLPLNEGAFRKILVPDTTLGTNIETLPTGQRGWYLVLDANERVINDPFALAGVTFFSTYKPRIDVTTTTEGPRCSKTGISRIFIVSTLTANPFVQPPSGVTAPATRQFEVSNFVTNPFTEQRQTKNVTGTTTVKEICDDPAKIAIMESLKTLFPPTCKFGNYMVDIKTIASDTSLVCIAPVPVCLITKNWKEF